MASQVTVCGSPSLDHVRWEAEWTTDPPLSDPLPQASSYLPNVPSPPSVVQCSPLSDLGRGGVPV